MEEIEKTANELAGVSSTPAGLLSPKEMMDDVNKLNSEDIPPMLRGLYENVNNEALALARLLAGTACCSVLAPRLRILYTYDKQKGPDMPLLNVIVVGPSGSGKSNIGLVVKIFLKGLLQKEMEQRKLLRDTQEANKRKGANRDKDQEPLVAIRLLQSFTAPYVVKLADYMYRLYGDWLPFFLHAQEVGAFIVNKHNKQDFQAMSRSAYNLGEFYSRDSLYEQGYNALCDIVWSSVMCCQPYALHEYLDRRSVVLGDAGRHIISKLDDRLGLPAPEFKPFTEQQQKDINEGIQKMEEMTFTSDAKLQPTHLVPMDFLDEEVEAWCAKQRIIIKKTQSRAHQSFHTRASLSAFRIAAIWYHLWGELPEHQDKIRRVYKFFARYILDGLLEEFGKIYNTASAKLTSKEKVSDAKPDLFELMPKRFTREELKQKMETEEYKTDARQYIYKWQKLGLIYEVEKDIYEKLYD